MYYCDIVRFTSTSGQALDFLGNWKTLVIDKDADGSDHVQQREHNDANEIAEIDPTPGSGGDELSLTYDIAGR